MLLKQQIDQIIEHAFQEDMNNGDITVSALLTEDDQVTGTLIAKEAGILAGLSVFRRVFELLDHTIIINCNKNDGNLLEKGDIIATISGQAGPILMGERTALNILQRMSGIATMTHTMVLTISHTNARLVDTRKTVPGLRVLDKWAVRLGGGHNHRFNLSDAVMIKDNHIKAVGSIKKAIEKARAYIPHTMTIEVETETLDQVTEAVKAGADIIMLDNMTIEQMEEAVKFIHGRAITEASGNIDEERIKDVAETGVDIISSGAITHSVKALDISLKFN
ncbi:MAG: carboxylating nicotinate-nucleotide diphosphorylase [Vallitaleaceae bacterium]|jgi:nicotinate-nucleotide pyrophosphorylase (carboxylating)|nr:carboxylating nicotinate-nucleotide diphosphorylase [Vallitaleaceae bacterium]